MITVRTQENSSLAPLTSGTPLADCVLAGDPLEQLLEKKFAEFAAYLKIRVADFFWPSPDIISVLAATEKSILITDPSGRTLAWASETGELPEKPSSQIEPDENSVIIRYPWDLLRINEIEVGALNHSEIEGTVRENVSIDGNIVLGKNSVLLPGVYIEGNAVIGENCKIGPNCYIRGNTSVGSGCHIGQAVEIKNSILMDNVSAGHLSYVGDSIIGKNTNLGAGTITANFRHDGRNHRSEINGKLIDTNRRKLGCIIGNDVHTGIHTSIYPGRKIWPHMSTIPGEIVSRDIR